MKLPFRKNKEFLSVLYDILGFYPHDIEVYRIAFSHKSLAYHREERPAGRDRKGSDRRNRSERPAKPLNNERLEFLGDAVLETVVSDILFRHYPHKREGFLTSTRSKIVQRETLNRLATDMGLEKLIQAAQGTDMSHTNIGGNAFEALMGAIYLDRGYKLCHWFISKRVIGHFIDVEAMAHKEVNFKSKLIEWSQKNRITIHFKDSSNEPKGKGFSSVISLEGIIIGRGNGRSKKESQQEAAKDALTLMRRDVKTYDSIFRAKEKRTAMEAEESFALPKIDEIEEVLARGKKKPAADAPVYEEKKAKRATSDSDAAYDTAYDADADYEVIDTPPAAPRLTAEDYAAKGLPLPPSEDDAQESEPSSRRQRKQNRGGKTVEEALAEKAQPERAAKAKPAKEAQKKEKEPTAEPAREKAPKEKPQRERAQREKQPRQKAAETESPQLARPQGEAKSQPAAAPAADPEVVVVKDLTAIAPPEPADFEPQPAAAPKAGAPAADLPADSRTEAPLEAEAQMLIDAYEAAGFSVTPPQQAPVPAPQPAAEAAATEAAGSQSSTADKAEEGLEDLSEVLSTLGAIPEEVEAEITAFASESVPDAPEPGISGQQQATFAQQDAAEEAAGSTVPEAPEAETPEQEQAALAEQALAEEAAGPTVAEASEAEAGISEEEQAYIAEQEAAEEAAGPDVPEDEAGEVPQAKPASLHDAAPKPILRHLSIDDFVFGTDPSEDQPFDADLEAEAERPQTRKPNRRRRRPSRHSKPEGNEGQSAAPRDQASDAAPEAKSGQSAQRRRRRRRPQGQGEA